MSVRKEWKAVMEFAKRTELRIRRNGEPKRLTRARTLMSRHAAVPCRIAGMKNNLFRRTTPPTRWIAAVSAAEKTSRGAAEMRRMFAKF